MAIAFLTGGGAQGNASSRTVSLDCTGATVLIAGVWCIGDKLNGIAYNSVAMTQIGTAFQYNTGEYLYMYYLANPTSGTNDVVASFSGTQNCALRVSCYSGTKAGAPEASNTNSGASGNPTGVVTSIQDNSIGVMIGRNEAGDPSASTNMTSSVAMGATAGSFAIMGYSALKTPPGTLTMVSTSTNTSVAWGAFIVSIPVPPITTTVSDTQVSTDTVSIGAGIPFTVSDTQSSTDTSKTRYGFQNQTKNTGSWTNQQKS